MPVINIIIFLISGLIIGSFLNVVIFRLDDIKSIINDRSRCRECKNVIYWYDLIPVLSFFLLRGRCRHCGSKIAWQYPLIELGTGLLFVILYLHFGLVPSLFFYLIIFSLLMIVSVYDIMTQYVPEFFVWTALFLVLAAGWYYGNFSFINSIIGALIGGGILLALVLISKEKWMGSGDIKLGVILGLMTGYPRSIFAIFAAFVLGSIVGLIYIYFTKKTLKSALPFAPFLVLAAFIALIWGQKIVDWYLGKLFF